jgi:hypothetical protein
MTSLEILTALSLIFLTAFNAYYLFYFKNRSKFPGRIEKIDNYYKLDAKIEFQKYLFLAIITIAGYFGINKFTDLSKESEKITKLETSFKSLENEYQKAQKKLDDLTIKNAEYERLLKTKEIDLIDLNYKIKDITRQIPEANIRLLTRQLVESNLRFAGVSLVMTNEVDSAILKREITKSKEMLRSAGYSTEEIDNLIKSLTPRH